MKAKNNQKLILKWMLKEETICQSFSRTAEILAYQQIKMEKPILDLGCGDGLFTEVLFAGQKHAVLVGIDLSSREINIAAKRLVYQEVKVADAEKLPYPSGSFATVTCNSSLEHMQHLDQVLLEVSRVLIPGGKFIFVVPHPQIKNFYLDSKILQKLGLLFLEKPITKLRHKLSKHLHLLNARSWRKKLQQVGLMILEEHYVGGENNYLVVDFFALFLIISRVVKALTNRRVLPPRWPIIFLAEKFLLRFLPQVPFNKKGPGLFIVAQKSIN